MVREFDSILGLAENLLHLEVGMHELVGKSLDTALVILEKDMVHQIGEYQGKVGPYPAWADLAESTEEEKARLGAPADAPLERFGDLMQSFQHERDGDEGIVGSTDKVMEYHEWGTDRMPPRPVVGPALERNRERIEALIGRATVELIAGGKLEAGAGADYLGEDIRP
jgi:phage gpG-like protein